jgi:hypothetical protein
MGDLYIEGGVVFKYVMEIGHEAVNWIHLAKGKYRWLAVVYTVVKLRVCKRRGITWLDETLLVFMKDLASRRQFLSFFNSHSVINGISYILMNEVLDLPKTGPAFVLNYTYK